MSEGLRNTIIGTVVGGLILSFILWLVSAWFPSVWAWIKDITLASAGFFTSEVSLPMWLVCVLSLGWVLLMAMRCSRLKRNNPVVAIRDLPAPVTDVQKAVESWPPPLSELETKIIAVLASKDGGKLTIHELAPIIGSNRLRASQGLESLGEKGLVKVARNRVHGDFYSLSSRGRDLAIHLEFA